MIVGRVDASAISLGVSGALVAVIVVIGVALARTREHLARLEEWIRVHEGKRSNL